MPLSLRNLALAASLLVLTATARADEPSRSPDPDEPTRYSFEDDQVLAGTIGPIGEVMQVRRRGQRESLVRARDSFVVELLQSVEAL